MQAGSDKTERGNVLEFVRPVLSLVLSQN